MKKLAFRKGNMTFKSVAVCKLTVLKDRNNNVFVLELGLEICTKIYFLQVINKSLPELD